MKLYRVTAALRHPGCYHTGYEFEIPAATKAKAITHARRMAYDVGHTRQDGALIYAATEIDG